MILSCSYVIDKICFVSSSSGYFVNFENVFDFLLTLGGVAFIIAYAIPQCDADNGRLDFSERTSCDVSRAIGVAVFLARFTTIALKHNALRMLITTILMGLFKSAFTFMAMVCS